MPNATLTPAPCELDSRTADGLTIGLWWSPDRPDHVQVMITDHRAHNELCFSVLGEHARDAFVHPFAYAP